MLCIGPTKRFWNEKALIDLTAGKWIVFLSVFTLFIGSQEGHLACKNPASVVVVIVILLYTGLMERGLTGSTMDENEGKKETTEDPSYVISSCETL